MRTSKLKIPEFMEFGSKGGALMQYDIDPIAVSTIRLALDLLEQLANKSEIEQALVRTGLTAAQIRNIRSKFNASNCLQTFDEVSGQSMEADKEMLQIRAKMASLGYEEEKPI